MGLGPFSLMLKKLVYIGLLEKVNQNGTAVAINDYKGTNTNTNGSMGCYNCVQ